MPTTTAAGTPTVTPPCMRLVTEALGVTVRGTSTEDRPDVFAPNFRFIGPARDLFAVPGSGLSSGDITDVHINLNRAQANGDSVVVNFDANGCCHLTSPQRPVSAHGVIVYRIAGGRVADAQGVVQWDWDTHAA